MAPAANQAFYRQLVDACTANKLVCGVYSSASQWNAIFGSTFVYGNDMPLWYAHYDNTPAFSDFQRFGGWAAPTIKQVNTFLCQRCARNGSQYIYGCGLRLVTRAAAVASVVDPPAVRGVHRLGTQAWGPLGSTRPSCPPPFSLSFSLSFSSFLSHPRTHAYTRRAHARHARHARAHSTALSYT